jgi:hypothetical protein
MLVPGNEPLADRERTERNAWLEALDLAGVSIRTGAVAVAVADAGVVLSAGETVPADVVAVALGGEPDPSLREQLAHLGGPRLRVVGDAHRPGRIHDAVHSAFLSARTL